MQEGIIAAHVVTNVNRKIATELKPAPTFWYAEDYHQQYLASPGGKRTAILWFLRVTSCLLARPYCSAMPRGVQMEEASKWLPKKYQNPSYMPKLNEAFWEKYGPTPHCVIREPHEQIEWP